MNATPTGTFASMAFPAYRTLTYGASLVIFGVMGQQVARGWVAKELTGTNAGLGGVMLAFGLSMLLVTPLGGVAADRYQKRTVLRLSIVALIVSAAGTGVVIIADVIEYWMLLAASVVQAAAFACYLPARIATISEIVPAATLGNAIVLMQTTQEAMRVVAPALAGVLIGVQGFGAGGVFLASAVTSGIAVVLLRDLPAMPLRNVEGRSPLGELTDAVRYIRSNAHVAAVALLSIGVVMVGFPYLAFLPSLAEDVYDVGAVGYGVTAAAVGIGAVLAGATNARFGRGTRTVRTICAAGLALGVALIGLGAVGRYELALAALVAVGGSALLFQTASQSRLLQISPLEYHGRLQSLVVLGFSGFGLAALPLGLLADAIGLRTTLAAMGATVLVLMGTFIAFVVRQRRRAEPGEQLALA